MVLVLELTRQRPRYASNERERLARLYMYRAYATAPSPGTCQSHSTDLANSNRNLLISCLHTRVAHHHSTPTPPNEYPRQIRRLSILYSILPHHDKIIPRANPSQRSQTFAIAQCSTIIRRTGLTGLYLRGRCASFLETVARRPMSHRMNAPSKPIPTGLLPELPPRPVRPRPPLHPARALHRTPPPLPRPRNTRALL